MGQQHPADHTLAPDNPTADGLVTEVYGEHRHDYAEKYGEDFMEEVIAPLLAWTNRQQQKRQPAPEQSRRHHYLWLLVLALLAMVTLLASMLAFGWYVWPTRYQHASIGDLPARFDRFTGETEWLVPHTGWEPFPGSEAGKPSKPEPEPQKLPQSALTQLEGQATIGGLLGNELTCRIYNGSDYILDGITIRLTLWENGETQEVFTRKYRLTSFGSGEPYAVTNFTARIGQPLEKGQSISWVIVNATGRRDQAEQRASRGLTPSEFELLIQHNGGRLPTPSQLKRAMQESH